MSKETFSKNMCEIMEQKIVAIEKYDLKKITEQSELFEVALCIAYLALSKEKIIEKDIKNNDRIGRLTQKVDTKEIDKVFEPGFAKEMPIIIQTKENNKLWILDNIRDSIMHGAIEIDETKKCFIINNNQYNRELQAEIPFSWFVAYAKNDILSKKTADHYTIKGFYYNKNKKNKKNLVTNKELFSNIIYRVNVSGNKFNIKNIENRVKELFDIYSQEELTEDLIEKYKYQIDKNKIKYNQQYLISFYSASEKIKSLVEQEFPGVSLNIYVDNKKHHFVNKATKKLPKHYYDYDVMFSSFNKLLVPRSEILLKNISHIIENIEMARNKINQTNKYDWKQEMDIIHQLLTGEKLKNYNHSTMTREQDLRTLLSISLSVYGLSTLVINHETLYSNQFLNTPPTMFGLRANLKQKYLDYANKRKSLIMKILETKIILFSKQDQLSKCQNELAKQKIQEGINQLLIKLNIQEEELNSLQDSMKFERIINYHEFDNNKEKTIKELLKEYYKHFEAANTSDAKKQIRKIIGVLLDVEKEEEAKYTYGYCDNMKDVLTIIRNCFSHTGRIALGYNNGTLTNIVLNDYDTNGEKSGEVICKYGDLINLLSAPYQKEKISKHK